MVVWQGVLDKHETEICQKARKKARKKTRKKHVKVREILLGKNDFFAWTFCYFFCVAYFETDADINLAAIAWVLAELRSQTCEKSDFWKIGFESGLNRKNVDSEKFRDYSEIFLRLHFQLSAVRSCRRYQSNAYPELGHCMHRVRVRVTYIHTCMHACMHACIHPRTHGPPLAIPIYYS